MNKKIFIKNKPFDVNDANDMQNWTEDALKKTMASIYSSGVVEGLNVVTKTGMQLTVNLGKAFNSNYDFINVSSNQTVTLTTANATNPRIDKIVISYLSSTTNNVDTANIYGMGTSFVYSQNKLDSFQLQVVTGTAAATPVAPATPAGTIALAQVYVAANATSFTSGNITDLRQFIAINSNINRPLVVFQSTAPTDTNTVWIDTTVNKAKIYYNSAWNIIDAKDADTLDGQHGSYYSPATHNHDTVYYTKSLTYSKTESDTNFLKKSDNLSTLANVATARTNLGLGSAATSNSTAFASSTHNHDGTYVKGDYVLTVGTTAPASPTTKNIWWDTNSSSYIIKRWDGASWIPLNANDATTLTGLIPGTGANNLLKLDSSGKIPYATIPLVDSYTSTSTTSAATPNSVKSAYDNALLWAKGFGLGTIAKSIASTDLNVLAAENGFYKGNSLTNAPGASTGFFYIIQLAHSTTYITQIAISFGSGTTLSGKEYRRQNNNGTWSAWEESVSASRTINVGTGLSGGGDLSADRTISFDTTWGDARYARKDIGDFTAQIQTTRTGGALLNLIQSDSDTAGMYNYLSFSDKTGAYQAYVGYPASSNGTLKIYNKLGDINLTPIGGTAQVNGSNIVTEGRSVLTGNGLTGGGSLAADRTISVSYGGNGSATTVARSDHSHTIAGSAITDVTITTPADKQLLAYDTTTAKWINQTAAGAGLAASARTISAGTGLTGGGDLTANRTLSVSFGGTGSATTVSRSDHNHDTTYAPIASPTFTGTTTSPNIRLTATGDASLTSTTHAFQIGLDTGTNLIIDANEIIGRNNGVASTVGINLDGGNVSLGNSSSTITANGSLVTGAGITNTGTFLSTAANQRFELNNGQYMTMFTGTGAVILSSAWTRMVLSDNSAAAPFVRFERADGTSGGTTLSVAGTVYTSDRELKKNIVDYTGSALNEINSTPIRQYNFKTELDTDLPHTGIILQEAPLEVIDPSGKGIDNYSMVTMSWKGIQELSAENEALKAENTILKGKISELEIENNIAKERISKLEERLSQLEEKLS